MRISKRLAPSLLSRHLPPSPPDIATVISDKCVNPESKRPYPVSMIEKAMRECHVAVKPNKSSKQQALETIAKLKASLPIERAQMRMKVVTPVKYSNKVRRELGRLGLAADVVKLPAHFTQCHATLQMRKQLKQLGAAVTVEAEEKVEDSMELILLVDPGNP